MSDDLDRRLNEWFSSVEPRQVPVSILPSVLSRVRNTGQLRRPWHRLAPAFETAWTRRWAIAPRTALILVAALLLLSLAMAGVAASLIRLPTRPLVLNGLIAVEAEQGPEHGQQIRFIDPVTGQDAYTTPAAVPACAAKYSPDGSQYAFLYEDSNDDIFIAVAPAQSDFSPSLLLRKQGQIFFDPAWAPDGSALATTIETGGDQVYGELWIVPTDGTSPRRVTDIQTSFASDWSQSGDWIAFVGVGPEHQLHLIRPDGSDQRRLAPNGVTSVAWSPARDELAYEAMDGRLHVITPDGQEIFSVADGRGPSAEGDSSTGARLPVWSPDATKIAVVASAVLNVFDVGGAPAVQITAPASVTHAAWSADSRSLIVTAGTGLSEVFLDGAQPRFIADHVRSTCMSAGTALSWQQVTE